MKYEIKPFVKWVGGKTQLLSIIKSLLPQNYNMYIEPFLGGGALFLELQPKKAIVNDINNELINSWKTIKTNPIELMHQLDLHFTNHSKDYFYHCRSLDIKALDDIQIASRFIYLNKTCFNGLYRLNSKGEFNVPFNQKQIINISTLYSKQNLTNLSKYLNVNNINIYNYDYLKILDRANANDFVFVDPPYDYENEQGFVDYSINKWTKKDSLILFNKLKELDKKGVKWLLTNHNTEFVNEQFKEFNIKNVQTNRFINSNANKRKESAQEVLIFNYNLDDE